MLAGSRGISPCWVNPHTHVSQLMGLVGIGSEFRLHDRADFRKDLRCGAVAVQEVVVSLGVVLQDGFGAAMVIGEAADDDAGFIIITGDE